MYELKNFDNWYEYEDAPHGSGASEKIWIVNKDTGKIGLFKFPKIRADGKITGEYWAEKLASEIGRLIGIECAETDIGVYNNRLGSLSYNFLNKDESLIEGITFISRKYPYYSGDKLLDTFNGEKYSIQMILSSIREFGLEKDFFKVPIFDCLIGNSDRHHSNWGNVVNIIDGSYRFAPLYDNGSSLCCYIDEGDAESIMKDSLRFNSQIYSKSKSLIGWKDIRPVRHFDLLEYLKDNYYDFIKYYLEIIGDKVTEASLTEIVNQFDENIISSKLKGLIVKYLLERKLHMIG